METDVENFLRANVPSEFYSPVEIGELGLDKAYHLEQVNKLISFIGSFDPSVQRPEFMKDGGLEKFIAQKQTEFERISGYETGLKQHPPEQLAQLKTIGVLQLGQYVKQQEMVTIPSHRGYDNLVSQLTSLYGDGIEIVLFGSAVTNPGKNKDWDIWVFVPDVLTPEHYQTMLKAGRLSFDGKPMQYGLIPKKHKSEVVSADPHINIENVQVLYPGKAEYIFPNEDAILSNLTSNVATWLSRAQREMNLEWVKQNLHIVPRFNNRLKGVDYVTKLSGGFISEGNIDAPSYVYPEDAKLNPEQVLKQYEEIYGHMVGIARMTNLH